MIIMSRRFGIRAALLIIGAAAMGTAAMGIAIITMTAI